jgi:hypothetical protein
MVKQLVIPAEAGIQVSKIMVPCLRRDRAWIPVFTPARWSATARKHGNDRKSEPIEASFQRAKVL